VIVAIALETLGGDGDGFDGAFGDAAGGGIDGEDAGSGVGHGGSIGSPLSKSLLPQSTQRAQRGGFIFG